MKILLLASVLLFSVLIIWSCKKDNPIPPEVQPQINLAVVDTSCTEVWLKLSTKNVNLPAEVTLKQDDSVAQTISLNSTDTLLYFDSLLPNHTYNFQSVIQSSNHSSNQINFTTMDTTSHNFIFQTWTFGGQAGSCTLYDVAIINENNIWAVGQIYLLDSLGQPDPYPYNLAIWDGTNWNLKKINYQGIPPIIHSILVINENDIWLDPWFHWNGQEFQQLSIPSILMGVRVNKMWGNSEGIFVVGNDGFIAHYQNGHWSRIESGTDMSLVDMTGTSGDNIFICGSDANNVKGTILKKNVSGFETFINSRIVTSQEIFHPDLFGSLPSIWLDEKNTLYAAGNLLYQYKFGRWDYVRSLPENFIGGNPGVYYRGYIADVKGMRSNDMWIVGDRNTLRHFNGVSWKQIGLPYSPDSDIVWYTVYPTENSVAVVGYKGNSAIVMLIRK
jgi:hypothetical protein